MVQGGLSPLQPGQGRALVAVDADNTLWDTHSVFADAQLDLLRRVESAVGAEGPDADRLRYVRQVDEQLARLHDGDLEYPWIRLVEALALRLTGMPPDAAARRAVGIAAGRIEFTEFAEDFQNRIAREVPPLRPGVKAGMKSLATEDVVLVLASEGNKARCEGLLGEHNLRGFFSEVIYARKSLDFYRCLAEDHGATAERRFMIGDQLDRDIEYASKAGFVTVHFPSGFDPSWQSSGENRVIPDFTIRALDEVPWIVSRALNGSALQRGALRAFNL
jgi:putative hydrolase of the HAD superfamily